MSAPRPADHAVRAEALDVNTSFIVRAPAGSGKTRLIIQRYLALLATVDAPEEVVAITFTRKAAAEMRERVMHAFASAETGSNETDPETAALARAARAHSKARNWQLSLDASRLRIQTIDALNASITRQMPLVARFGAQPSSVDDASVYYRDAARATLALLDSSHERAEDVATLLTHLDNNAQRAEALVADMLAGRDKWLRHLHGFDDRKELESALRAARLAAIHAAERQFPEHGKQETLALARFSRKNRLENGSSAGVWHQDIPAHWPAPAEDALSFWLLIADLMLTQSGTLRSPRGLNVNCGFPPGNSSTEKAEFGAMKKRMGALLEQAGEATPTLADALHRLRSLPDAEYRIEDWHILEAITRLLPVAAAMLWNVFAARGQCDFTQIAQAAVHALGPDEAPTDLSLSLDYRIRHLLIDEFQDTSFAQFELLEKLVRGWSTGDGRTFFAVGDPMQSIYRFRNAEVGLYLRATHFGVGGVALKPLTLTVNFRSAQPVIDWVNATFAQLMPIDAGDLNRVPFSPSAARPGASAAGKVEVHPLLVRGTADDVRTAEAALTVDLVRAALAETDDDDVAILVRSRAHLATIVPALKAAGIAFKAVEIDPLAERGVVRDLVALTRALLHPADRAAWLAVLRAPWCALTAHDLVLLMGGATPTGGELQPDARTIWDIAQDASRVAALSARGQARIAWTVQRIAPALDTVRRMKLIDVLEPLWLSLLGPACLEGASTLEDAHAALDTIEREADAQTGGGSIEDFAALDRAIARLFAAPQVEARVEIMTLHKAKGLEFESVILPGLERRTQGDANPLMVWHEEPDAETGEPRLLLAPIRATDGGEKGDGDDATYRYVRELEKVRQRAEDARLLYVAATRAKRALHLIGTARVKDGKEGEEVIAPASASLLGCLWPVIESAYAAAVAQPANASTQGIDVAPTSNAMLRALSVTAALPAFEPPVDVAPHTSLELQSTRAGFDWAGETARHIGTVVHAWLQRIAEEGVARWTPERLGGESQRIALSLLECGVAEEDLAPAGARVTDALTRALEDPRGRWVLGAHLEAQSEWRISGVIDHRIVHMTLDRTFIDDTRTRWIIDYKTGTHEGGDPEAFLDNERERYRAQLEGYAALVAALDRATRGEALPIRMGLYFPAMRGWREWNWPEGDVLV